MCTTNLVINNNNTINSISRISDNCVGLFDMREIIYVGIHNEPASYKSYG